MDRFGVTAALVTYPDVNPRAALFAPSRWALVYRDAEALIFAARVPAFAGLIAERELPLTFAFSRSTGVSAAALAGRAGRIAGGPLRMAAPAGRRPARAGRSARRAGGLRAGPGTRRMSGPR